MEETMAEKVAAVFEKRRPKQSSYGLGELKAHLDKGEDFVTYAVAREEENRISHVARRVSVSINGSCEEWAKEKAKRDDPAPNEPNDDRPPMGIREFCDFLDEGKAFLIIKDSDGDYVIHELAKANGGFTLAEPTNEWPVLALDEYVDEHPDEGSERWWLEGDEIMPNPKRAAPIQLISVVPHGRPFLLHKPLAFNEVIRYTKGAWKNLYRKETSKAWKKKASPKSPSPRNPTE